jgi:phosphoglycerate dehydrogenase-like enzyme
MRVAILDDYQGALGVVGLGRLGAQVARINVVLSPHLGYVTEENLRLHYGESVENIEAFLRGAPLRVLAPR